MYRLNQIAHIISGHPFRKKIQHCDYGDIHVLQMKNIKHQAIDWSEAYRINAIPIKLERFLQLDDILLLVRGRKNTAVLIDAIDEKSICSAHFFIIRIKDREVIDPYFLWWQLNQKGAQRYFSSRAQGSDICSVSRTAVENFEVPVVPLDEQLSANEYVKNIYAHRRCALSLVENDEKIISRFADTFVKEPRACYERI